MSSSAYGDLIEKELSGNPSPATPPAPQPAPTAATAPAPDTVVSKPAAPPATETATTAEPHVFEAHGVTKQELEEMTKALPPDQRAAFTQKIKGLEKGMFQAFRERAELKRQLAEHADIVDKFNKAKAALQSPWVQRALMAAPEDFTQSQAPPNLDEMDEAQRLAYLEERQARTLQDALERFAAEKLSPVLSLVETQQRKLAQIESERERQELLSNPETADFAEYEDRIAAFRAEHPTSGLDTKGVYYFLKGQEARRIELEAERREIEAKKRMTTERPQIAASGTTIRRDYMGSDAAMQAAADFAEEARRQGRTLTPEVEAFLALSKR